MYVYVHYITSGVGNLRPASNSCAARQVSRGKEIIWMNNIRTLASVMSAARNKNYNVFVACGGKNVAHTALHS